VFVEFELRVENVESRPPDMREPHRLCPGVISSSSSNSSRICIARTELGCRNGVASRSRSCNAPSRRPSDFKPLPVRMWPKPGGFLMGVTSFSGGETMVPVTDAGSELIDERLDVVSAPCARRAISSSVVA